jgi:cytochrome P450
MTQAAVDLDQFDPFSEGWGQISYETMRQLRSERPVAHVASGFWYLARYEDCRRALGDAKTFSNAGGLRGPGVVIPREERMINEMDPPDHTRLRKLEQSTLNQTSFRGIAPYIQQLCHELVAALPRGQAIDVIAAVTNPLPSMVASRLIGVPVEEYEQFARWSHEVSTSTWITENRNERGEGLAGAHPEFSAYIDTTVARRRAAADPPDDLVTRLATTEIDGDRMTDTEIRITLAHLIIAGNATTTHLLGNLLYRTLETPGVWEGLRNQRDRIRPAIEESLRLDAVVQLLTRKCREDVELSGVKIPAGARVVVGIASANRDEAAFGPDADRFRIDRDSPPMQLTFGFGPHLCLGADLARLEAQTLVNTLLDQVQHVGPAGELRFERIPTYWELGPARLEVILEN